jgi:hypothetical protein
MEHADYKYIPPFLLLALFFMLEAHTATSAMLLPSI